MTRRGHLLLVALILALLAGVGVLALPQSPVQDEPILGLDLQGGLEVVLQAVPPPGRELTEEDLDRSVEIMRSRVDKLGVAEPEIRKQVPDQIVIDLPGIRNPGDAVGVIGKTAQLELFDLQANLVEPSIDPVSRFPVATESLHDLLAARQSTATTADSESWYAFDDEKKLVVGPVAERETALAAAAAQVEGSEGELPKGWKLFGVPPETVVVSCGVGEVVCPGVNQLNPKRNFWYLLRYDPENGVPEMTGEDLELDGTRQDFDPQSSQPIVLMQFTDEGADKFHDITGAIAQRGRLLTNTVGGGEKITQNFAIVLDREIKSWPSIDWEQYPNGIAGNNGAQITGLDSLQEAQNLALVLQTGALPVEFKTLERTDISATLGKDSLDEAKQAAIAGLLVVALFLLVVYRFLGLVAVIGLGVYAAFLYAAILLLNVTLTLPGFAGMILTLGVAADANIVIFERIKEEYRAGRSVRAAIGAGYQKGFATIVDANVVTVITALVLFAVATAGVKGFALMLLIGTVISLLTAVVATRAILGLLAGFKWFDNPHFMGAAGKPWKWIQRDFIGRRNAYFALSGVILAVSIGTIAFKGLNFGIEFEGGTQVTFSTPQPAALEDVRARAAAIGQGDAQILGRGETSGADRYTQFTIRTGSLDRGDQAQLTNALETQLSAESIGVRNVSASFGEQIARAALLAIFVSLLLVVIYIAVRFQLKFAGPTMAAMLHDLTIAIGIYALVGQEVTTATVAALLTVFGYSIYDTIIIFDRMRENLPLMRRSSFRTIANVSLWETIPRSLATTFITLLPIVTLYFFGGETLKAFAFALLVGIGSGAYSSIFFAPQLLSLLKEREPEFARRRDDVTEKGVGGAAVLQEAEAVAAAQPAPSLVEAITHVDGGDGDGDGAVATEAPVGGGSKRERRRQRRQSRPHGRAR